MDSNCNDPQQKQQVCKFDAIQIQFKDKLFKGDSVQISFDHNSISLTLLNLSMEIRINLKDIISVAKNSKSSNIFYIIILTKGVQTQQQFYDEEEEQQDQINRQLTKEQQIIEGLQVRRKQVNQMKQNNLIKKIFQLEGFFSVKIGKNLIDKSQQKLQEKKNSQNAYIDQLQKHIGANDYKNTIIEESENLYEKMIKRLNQLQQEGTNQNNNAGIHSLISQNLMGQEQNYDEEEWAQQENMDEQEIKE